MKHTKLGLIGLASAALGFVAQGCFAPQPPGECTVVSGAAAFGITNYAAKLDKTAQTGTGCVDLTQLEVGMIRYAPPGKPMTVDIRTSRIVDINEGRVFEADIDDSNNCTNEEGCEECVRGNEDAGYTLADGTSVSVEVTDAGTTYFVPEVDGGVHEIDVANMCDVSNPDAIDWIEKSDPQGLKLNISANMPESRIADKDGVCKLSNFSGGERTFEPQPLVGGGEFPGFKVKVEFSSLDMVNTTKAPATYWTAKLKHTEGACITDYDVTGFWPIVHCTSEGKDGGVVVDESACDPNADLDAGRISGSGISPNFKSKCDAKLGLCIPTVTAKELK
jgi:hypothetical protein